MKSTLKESFENCRGKGIEVMKGIIDGLDNAKIPYHTNQRGTEIVAECPKDKVRKALGKKGSEALLDDFAISAKECRNRTYLRLLYQ